MLPGDPEHARFRLLGCAWEQHLRSTDVAVSVVLWLCPASKIDAVVALAMAVDRHASAEAVELLGWR